jgi:F-type H+-transporting ATPase subunit delta
VANETVARRYATAIFELAREANATERVGHDLHTVEQTLATDDAIKGFFRSPVVDRKEKAQILGRAFDMLHEVALHAVLLLVRKRRESIFEQIVAQYDALEMESRGAAPLRIESARELGKPELDALVQKLAERYSTTFQVEYTVNSELIAGLRITIGDTLVDDTVAGRLDNIARLLSTN